MKRDPRALTDAVRDVLVIGGGIHGAAVAWDAVLRGLTVALVERSDFGSGTSANSLKIVHGGLRYLQHGDVRRMRESITERRTLLRIAPHLVRPLPVIVPTRGRGRRALLRLALTLNDLVGLDRNAGLDAGHRLGRGRTISRRECLRLAPGLDAAGLTGAGIFHDAQVYSSERLVLAFLRSAVKAGAEVANYAAVTGLRPDRDGLLRAAVDDRLTGADLTIRARAVVNATGPWVDEVLGLTRPQTTLGRPFARAFNLVTRRLFPAHAVALLTGDEAGLVRPGARRLFVVPWREQSLVGTWYEPHAGPPGENRVTEAEVARLLAAIDQACPALALRRDDVRLLHAGLLPLAGGPGEGDEGRLATRGRIVDHAHHGLPGLLSIVGVKATTARLMAERVVDRVFERQGRTPPPSLSAVVPLHGGEGDGAAPAAMLSGYGSAGGEVLAHLDPGDEASDPIARLRAEVRHAIRTEMAHTLADVVFRRTELGSAGDPGPALLGAAARTCATELGWSPERERDELRAVYGRFGVPR